MCNDDGYEDEDRVFCHLLCDLRSVPGHLIQPPLCLCVAFDPIFNFSEHHFHEERLRACPATPNAPEHNCEQNDEYKKGDQSQGEEEEILGPERLAHNHEFSFEEVEQQQRLPVDPDKRTGEEDDQQYDRDDGP